MIYLHKILPLFVMPIMVFLLIIVFGVYNNKRKVIYISAGLFYVFSTPLFSNYLFKVIEGEYHRKSIEQISNADAIVVLSGMLRINELNNTNFVEWGDVDRLFGGIELYNAKKSNIIVFTGGKNPYNKTIISEGEILKEYAIKNGVNSEDILVTEDVLNTSDESIAVSELLGNKRKILLVTSAFHMQRAKSLFELKGFNVIPYKVDYKTPPKINLNFISFLPSSNSLSKTENALREILGRLYYKWFYN